MTDEDGQSEGDAATEAFAQLEAKVEQMRGEMALMRRAVESVAAERASIDVPDYNETLGGMVQMINATFQRVDALVTAAKDAVVPRYVADRIVAAGGNARAEDQRTIATARQGLEDATRALHGLVVSARRGDEQNRWLAWSAIGGAVLGMILWAAFAGAVARTVPESWLWPEKMAARTLRLPMWEASRRLAATSAPETWNTMVAGEIIVQGNREAIERCRKAAAKAREAVRCTVSISPEGRR